MSAESRLDRAVAAMKAAPWCPHMGGSLSPPPHGCDTCARRAVLAALRVVLADVSDAAVEEADKVWGSRARIHAAFAATLAELEQEARR